MAVAISDPGKRRRITSILQELNADTNKGRVIQNADRLHALQQLSSLKALPTFAPLLPGFLNFNGKPFTIDDHFPFASLFYTAMPKRSAYCTGRQTGKSTSAAAAGSTRRAQRHEHRVPRLKLNSLPVVTPQTQRHIELD